MAESRNMAWEPLFPLASRYEGFGLPDWLAADLAASEPGGPARVLVTSGAQAGDLPDLAEFEGLVALNSSVSPSRLRETGFDYVENFAAIPNIQDPRWLVPLNSGAVAAGALNIYTPYRRAAQLKLRILQLLFRTGPVLWRPQRVTVARRQQPELLRTLNGLLAGSAIHLTISTGTPGAGRKSTIAAIDGQGAELAFAKVASTSTAEQLMHNEASILREVGFARRLPVLAPRLLFEGQSDGRLVTIQSPVAGRAAPKDLGERHSVFLQTLSLGRPRPVAESALLRSLPERLASVGLSDGYFPMILDRAARELAGVELSPTVMHGDFAPWNLRLQKDAIAAFDWEYGVLDAIPGLDELHHHWQTGFLLYGWSANQAEAFLREWALQPPTGLGKAQAEALVKVYLLQALAQRLETGHEDSDQMVGRYFELLRRQTMLEVVQA